MIFPLLALAMYSMTLYGTENTPATYLFSARKENPGFFSAFNSIVGALDYVERKNGTLLVDFGTSGWYYDRSVGPNWFGYYFDLLTPNPPTGIPIEFKAWQKIRFSLIAQFEIEPDRAYKLIQRYIQIKDLIQRKIDSFFASHLNGSYIIGIHYRGTDKYSEAPPVTYATMFSHIDVALAKAQKERGGTIKLFVATDDQHFLDAARKKYPNRVYAWNAPRSTGNNAVHTGKTGSPYEKGESAIIDAVLLSKCNFLIKTASNLSDASLMFNPNLTYIRVNNEYFRG